MHGKVSTPLISKVDAVISLSSGSCLCITVIPQYLWDRFTSSQRGYTGYNQDIPGIMVDLYIYIQDNTKPQIVYPGYILGLVLYIQDITRVISLYHPPRQPDAGLTSVDWYLQLVEGGTPAAWAQPQRFMNRPTILWIETTGSPKR